MKVLAAALLSILLHGPGGCTGGGDGGGGRPAEKLTPRMRGELRARNDISRGKSRVFIYGNPLSRSNPRFDEQSGLPVRVLIDCCVSAESFEETEAYNRVMRESAAGKGGEAAGGPAPSSRDE